MLASLRSLVKENFGEHFRFYIRQRFHSYIGKVFIWSYCGICNFVVTHRHELSTVPYCSNTSKESPCGGSGWTKIADIDMNDHSQQCPGECVSYENTYGRGCKLQLSQNLNKLQVMNLII